MHRRGDRTVFAQKLFNLPVASFSGELDREVAQVTRCQDVGAPGDEALGRVQFVVPDGEVKGRPSEPVNCGGIRTQVEQKHDHARVTVGGSPKNTNVRFYF